MSVQTNVRKPAGYKGCGRPTKLTPELASRIADLIREGNYITIACQATGIDRTTYTRWLQLGEEDHSQGKTDTVYSSFYTLLKKAEAEAEVLLLQSVRRHTDTNPIAGLALLDRRFRDRWGQTQQPATTITLNVDKQLVMAGRRLEDTLKTMTARQSLDVPTETQHEVQHDTV